MLEVARRVQQVEEDWRRGHGAGCRKECAAQLNTTLEHMNRGGVARGSVDEVVQCIRAPR